MKKNFGLTDSTDETNTTPAAPSFRDGRDRIVTTEQAAAVLSLKPGTLEKARSTGLGDYPNYVRLGGRRVGYRLSDIEAWVAERVVSHDGSDLTSQAK